jgi:hypothetical protein
MYFAIKIGSITNAQRTVRALKSKGYRPSISKIENPRPNDGCGYVVKVFADDKDNVVNILQKSNISFIEVEAL